MGRKKIEIRNVQKTDDEWYQTVGEEHLKNFFNMIVNAIILGEQRGLNVKNIDLTEVIRIYRGPYHSERDTPR